MLPTQKSSTDDSITQQSKPRRSERQKIPSPFYAKDFEDPLKISKKLMMKYAIETNHNTKSRKNCETNTKKANHSIYSPKNPTLEKQFNDEYLAFRMKDDPNKVKYICFTVMDSDTKSSGFSSEIGSTPTSNKVKSKAKEKSEKRIIKSQETIKTSKKEAITESSMKTNFLDKVLIAAMRVQALRTEPNDINSIKDESLENQLIPNDPIISKYQNDLDKIDKPTEYSFIKEAKIEEDKLILDHSTLGPIKAKYKTEKPKKVIIPNLEHSSIFNIPQVKSNNVENGIQLYDEGDIDMSSNNKKDNQQTLQDKIDGLKNHFHQVFKTHKPSIIT